MAEQPTPGGRLGGRTVLLVGAGGGIGGAVAERLSFEGARLFLADIAPRGLADTARSLSSSGSVAGQAVVDITSSAAVADLVHEAHASLGRLDVMVNCAGVVSDLLIDEITDEDWDRVLRINLTGTFILCRAVLPLMTAQGHGRLINLSSQLAQVGAAGHAAYAAAKAGVIALTKSIAHEYSPFGVTANCIAPGPIDTPMLSRSGRGWRPERIARLPLRRVGHPAEVTGTVVLLASELDGALYTGQVLGPNCGDVM